MPLPVPQLLSVPAGSVTLRDARTGTSRIVELQSFDIAPVPVTWELYSRMLDLPIPSGDDGHAPAHSVSWWAAVRCCNILSRAEGLAPAYRQDESGVSWDVSADGFRLPTEAEWEFACRAGSEGPRYGPLADVAWTSEDAVERAQQVGLKQPNSIGLFDMLGNVWEWCWDYADPARYANYRVLRGGGWADQHWSVRASVRRGSMPETRLDDIGFRLCQGPVGAPGARAGQGWSETADDERAQIGGLLPPGWTPLGR